MPNSSLEMYKKLWIYQQILYCTTWISFPHSTRAPNEWPCTSTEIFYLKRWHQRRKDNELRCRYHATNLIRVAIL